MLQGAYRVGIYTRLFAPDGGDWAAAIAAKERRRRPWPVSL
jgi:hypothetical protein